ncbi:MAG: ATP-binding cassette domain-containing protein [Planctomycetota bacterium]|jgi:iron complex transport system ATP-binding protein|nr:ATP-binding cassette domain-containing protein [Planctomycetota bacterium]
MNGYENLIQLENLFFRRNGREILGGVSWTMPAGENWAVIGANGSGKTTLLQIAGGVLHPTAGKATVLGCRFGAADLFQLRRRIGWVGAALSARTPRHETALETVLTGIRATLGVHREYSAAERARALDLLERAGLAGIAESPFGVLSQGEQQRTLFLRALMPDPELLVLDEACAGLDIGAREEFLRNVGAIMARRKTGAVMATHHIEEIPPGTDRALVLKGGRVLAAGPVESALTAETLSEAFGVKVRVERGGGRYWARTGRSA